MKEMERENGGKNEKFKEEIKHLFSFLCVQNGTEKKCVLSSQVVAAEAATAAKTLKLYRIDADSVRCAQQSNAHSIIEYIKLLHFKGEKPKTTPTKSASSQDIPKAKRHT